MPKKKTAKKKTAKKTAKATKKRWFLRLPTDPENGEGTLFTGLDPKHLHSEGCLCDDGVDQIEEILGGVKYMQPGALIELSAKVVESGITDAQKNKPGELMKTVVGRQYLKEALEAYDD